MHDAFMVTLVTNVSHQNFNEYDGDVILSGIGKFYLLSVTEKDMKGTECRLNLLRFTSLMHQYTNTHVLGGRDLYYLLISLVELQKSAYADDDKRKQKCILRAYSQSIIFATVYIKLFGDPTKTKTSHRSMFGMLFHNMSVLLPYMLCLVSRKSIMAEAAELCENEFI